MTGRANPRSPSPEARKRKKTANSRHRATSIIEQRPSPNHSANEEVSPCRKEAHQCSLMHRKRVASANVAAIKLNPESRLNAAQQLQIVDLFFAGYSYAAIARQLHRNRRTVTRICRSPEIQTVVEEMKQKLLAESDDWLESINFAVQTEAHGELAFRLCTAFGIVPPNPEKNGQPVKPNDWEGIDPETLARAKVLGQIALERGSAMRLENDQLEKLVSNDPVESNRSCRLFAKRD